MRALCTLLFSTAAGVAVLARLRRFKPFCGRGLRYINKLRRKVFTTTAFVGVVGAVTLGDSCMMLEYWRRNPDRKTGQVFTTAVSGDAPTMQTQKFNHLLASNVRGA